MLTFIVIWAGQLVSTLGSGLTSFALGVWVYQKTGSETLFAITLLTSIIPNIVFSPLAGVLSDRWDRRIVMMLSDTGAGCSSLFIALMLFTSRLEIWHIYLATFFNSAFSTFQWPAYSAATSLLVPKQHLGRANGLIQVSDAIGALVTPALAGMLFVTIGLNAILLIDAATYLVAVGTLLAVRFPQPERSQAGQESRGSFWHEASYGWRYIRQRPGLLGLLSVFACMNFLLSATYPLLTPMLLDISSPDMLGYIQSVSGVGLLAGTLVLSIWGGSRRRIYGIYIAESLVGLSMMLLGLRPSIALIAIGGFGIMAAMPISNGSSQALWQSKVALDVQGRVFAVRRMIAFSIMPVAYIISGPLAERVFNPLMEENGILAPILQPLIGAGPGRGIGLMFILAGVLYSLSAFVVMLHPRIRRVELELPDVVEVASPE